MKMNNSSRKTEQGSVLVFILIGVALFAALSYAVSQSLRVGADSSGAALGTTERNSTNVTDLMQFLDALKMRVFEMGANNVPDTRLDFRNEVYELPSGGDITANNNASCGGANDCSVFSPASSSGILPMIFNNAADTPQQTSNIAPKNGHGRVGEINIKGVGTTAPDLVFVIYGIKPAICNLYNAKQGIKTEYDSSTSFTSLGESSAATPAPFAGFVTSNSFGYNATMFAGKKSFCAPAVDGIDHKLAIWHVLKIR